MSVLRFFFFQKKKLPELLLLLQNKQFCTSKVRGDEKTFFWGCDAVRIYQHKGTQVINLSWNICCSVRKGNEKTKTRNKTDEDFEMSAGFIAGKIEPRGSKGPVSSEPFCFESVSMSRKCCHPVTPAVTHLYDCAKCKDANCLKPAVFF